MRGSRLQAGAVVGGVTLIILSTACGSSAPAPPTAPSGPPVKIIPIAATMDELLLNRPLPYQQDPKYIEYAACGFIQNVGGQNLIFTTELLVDGPDGTPYSVEQFYDNLVPKKYGPGGGTLGCGFSSSRDYNIQRAVPARARLLVHYTQDDGTTGTVETSTSNIRDTSIPP